MSRRYWLFKSEPEAYSFSELLSEPTQSTGWDGVRNYQARNLMRDQMKLGDLGFFYHSRIKPPQIVGVVEITKEAIVDPTQFDPDSHYFDPKSKEAAPRWWMVEVTARQRLRQPVTLPQLKADPALSELMVTKKGSRLSVQPVSEEDFEHILALGDPEAV